MVKVTNAAGDSYSGTIGKSRVYGKWKGIQYARKWVKPSNPRSPAQVAIRNSFTAAVDRTHTWNSYQKEAYKFEASGRPLTWFNLFISDWQLMTAEERLAYVDPYYGIKQFGAGAANTSRTVTNVTDTREATTANVPIVIGSCSYTKSTGTLDPYAFIDILRGAVYVVKAITGAITIDYVSQGKTVTAESLGTDADVGDVLYLANAPVDYKTAHLKVAAAEVSAYEVDPIEGKFYSCKDSTFTGGSTIGFSSYTPILGVNLVAKKAATNFKTWNGYSDADGCLDIAQIADGGARDITISQANYISIVESGVSASDAAKDEYIALTLNA